MNWRIVAIALAIAGACALGGYWKGHHDADQANTVKRLTDERDSMARTITAYRDTNQKLTEIAKDAKEQADKAGVIAANLRHSADGMHRKLQDIASLYLPGTTTGSATTREIIGLLAGLLDEAGRTADDLANEAERYRRAGWQCEQAYDAVKRSQAIAEKR